MPISVNALIKALRRVACRTKFAYKDGKDMVIRLLHKEYNLSPDHPIHFQVEPRTVAGISSAAIKKIDYDK
ncbi:hypothetical protein E4H12_14755 [Candidatus Thorarchaeota archaeon]|nr:MAG: hypothetical protein E4H12_14755 [Candidatus Thorarchaeota archaeon]